MAPGYPLQRYAGSNMLKWLSRSKSKPVRRVTRGPRLRTADAQMQVEAIGRLPQGVAEGGSGPEPAPEYIPEAAEPSEDVWAREQELYRRKQEQGETGP